MEPAGMMLLSTDGSQWVLRLVHKATQAPRVDSIVQLLTALAPFWWYLLHIKGDGKREQRTPRARPSWLEGANHVEIS